MKWLARLKKIEIVPEVEPTETTKTVSVVFVGSIPAPVEKTGGVPAAANDGEPDPDRWCYPYSEAMNTREIGTFTARLARFTDRGLSLTDGERLADSLVQRDRERDDRTVCLECTHLQRGWRCANWQRAGVARTSRDAQLPDDLVQLFQRCDGFMGVTI